MSEQRVVPIAIIGLGCRFPGGANNPEKLWELLADGRSAWSDVPSDRWNWKSFYHPSPEFNGAHNHRGGHFLDQDISAFDANFFGIPTTEAKAIDPQQRIQLETAYEALENAGIPLESIRGSKTSVFVAVFSHDYDRFIYKDVTDVPQYHTTGSGAAIISNRISYLFDLKGPSMTIDTGCSGSLVALHQACQSLRLGESDMALVGGTNLILGPDQMVAMSMLSLLNDDGKSYAFDSRGSGYGRGEGVATVILKRLDDALQDSDPIRAIIRNTGVNQDGRTSGITLPNQESQQMLVRSVYNGARLDPLKTTYVEAHGTGTIAGDSIELRALANVFCNNGDRVGHLHVGSIKSNIGHLESSSGIAGLIKTVLVLERGLIPPNINIESIKKDLNLEEWKIKVPRNLETWPNDEIRRASLNSFGYGGTNAHAILEASSAELYSELIPKVGSLTPPLPTKYTFRQKPSFTHVAQTFNNGENIKLANESKNSPRIFVITARSGNSLLQSVNDLKKWLASGEENDGYFRDLAFTLSSRRSLMHWRTSIIASTYRDLVSLLERDPPMTKIVAETRIGFVFTGQGAQWHAMGRGLIFSHSAFHDSLSKADDILKKLGAPWSVIEELVQNEAKSRINQSDIAQPTTTAIQLAIVDMLESLGITPAAVVGHSSGEIAAAYAAGILSQQMALRISYHRGFIANAVKQVIDGKGAMLAVGSGEEEVLTYVSKVTQGIITVACINSPSSTTISGDEAGIVELQEILNNADIFNRRLKVDTAYHSHHMQKVADQYLTALEGVEAGTPNKSVKFFSSVSGEEKVSEFGASYWVTNLVSQVRFSDALTKLSAWQSLSSKKSSTSHHLALVEVGPHSALAGPIRQIMAAIPDESIKYSYVSCLLRDRNAKNTILEVVGKLFNQGVTVDLLAANSLDGSTRTPNVITDLFPYPWDHSTKYWHESRLSKEYRLRQHPYHDLLGTRIITSTAIEPSWRHMLSVSDLPWLQEHMIDGSPIFPGSAYLCMAIEAMRQIIQDREITKTVQKFVLKEVSWIKALIIPESPIRVEVQICLRPPTVMMDSTISLAEDFQITSLSSDGTWNLHCRGTVVAEYTPSRDDDEALYEQRLSDLTFEAKLANMMSICTQQLNSADLYNEFKSNGNLYGPKFATIDDFHFGPDHAVGKVSISDISSSMPSGFLQPHILHPTTLDTLIHSGLPLFYQQHTAASVMPVACREISISADIAAEPGQDLTFGTTLVSTGTRSSSAEVMVFYQYPRAEQNPVLTISGLELFGIGEAIVLESPFNRSLSYRIEWKEDADFISTDALNSSDPDAHTQVITPEEKLGILNRAASVYINRCLLQIPDESMVTAKHHIEYWRWMKKFHYSDRGKRFVDALTNAEVEQTIEMARSAGVEGALLSRIGPNITSILTGEINSVQFMCEDDISALLNTPDNSMLQCFDRMNKYLEFLTFKDPNLVILEIGAGVGSATSALFRTLSNGCGSLPLGRYDYTDISSKFFNQAKGLLSEWTNVLQFKVLNIELDPIEQGFVEGSYDLIIASNVLHKTNHIHSTLVNVRKLLKPEGKLLLIEVTKPAIFYNTCFSILESWSAGVTDGRIDSPHMSANQWDTALTQAAFSGISTSVQDYEGGAHRFSMMVSKAYERNDSLPIVEILSETGSVLASKLSARFNELGFRSSVTPWRSDPVSKEAIYVILDDSEKPILSKLSAARFSQVVSYVTQSTQILWISVSRSVFDVPDPLDELITGFSRTARAENESLKFVTLSTHDARNGNYTTLVERISEILLRSFGSETKSELEYRFINGKLLIPRLVPDEIVNRRAAATAGKAEAVLNPFIQEERPLKLQLERRGLLDNVVFIDDVGAHGELKEDDIEISVKSWGVNTDGFPIALGQTKMETPLVGECAGIVTAVGSNFKGSFRVGDRVCAWSTTPSSRARVRGYNAYRLPDNMSFSEGASIPVAFVTAYYGLNCLADLQEHQKVLIHDATGAVGQAAIKIAKYFKAEIFATADSAEKRKFLVAMMQIPESHVFSSKTPTFKKAIIRFTHGTGVDVVLNSLTDELLHETWTCVAKFGTFIEVGRGDAAIKAFDRNITLVSVDMLAMSRDQPEKAGRIFQSAMSMFDTEAPPAIQPITVFNLSVVDDAFRLVQSRNTIGKVVLEADASTLVRVVSAKPAELSLNRESSYIVAGGLGYVGRHICRFMASHGATHIIIPTRRKINSADYEAFEEEVRELGAQLYFIDADLKDSTQVQEFVSYCKNKFPPLRGVVQAAVSYQDRPLEQMTLEEFQGALGPKVNGTINLSNALLEFDVDFFIMLSSVVAVLGNKAQANYAAGSTFQDGFAHSKSRSETHYFSLNLGLVEGGSNAVGTQNLIRQGCIPLELEHLFISLTYVMCGQARKDNCNQVVLGFDRRSISSQENNFVLRNPLFNLLPTMDDKTSPKENKVGSQTIGEAIAAAKIIDEVRKIIAGAIAKRLASLVAIDIDDLDFENQLSDYGLDSLIAIELRNWISRTFDTVLQTAEIFDSPNILALSELVCERSKLVIGRLS